jgi:hypothetical protein
MSDAFCCSKILKSISPKNLAQRHTGIMKGGKLKSRNITFPLPSFPSALQLKVSFGLLNIQPPFLSILHLFRR